MPANSRWDLIRALKGLKQNGYNSNPQLAKLSTGNKTISLKSFMNRSGTANLLLRRTAAADAESLHKPSSHYNLCGLTGAGRNPQHML